MPGEGRSSAGRDSWRWLGYQHPSHHAAVELINAQLLALHQHAAEAEHHTVAYAAK
jgi:hypothetical protein